MIVDYQYDYWGDNGRYHESKLEEYEDEREAILDLGSTADYRAIKDTFKINRVLGGDEGIVERLTAGVVEYVAKMERLAEITKLKRDIAINEVWFQRLDEEKEIRSMSLYQNRAKLIKLLAYED